MLLEFKVRNFMSIKDELVFSLEATSKNDLEDNISIIEKNRVLKSACILGANAHGKSNIINAFTSAIIFIRISNRLQDGEKLFRMRPFKLDDITAKEPCFFEFTFITNNTKYRYGFTADINMVHEEYLYKYSSSKASLIFKRTNTNNYEFPQPTRAKLNEIKEKNTDNKLFLSTANVWNFNEVKEAFNWFTQKIDTYDDFSLDMFNVDKYTNPIVKKNVLKILEAADFSIKDFHIKLLNRKTGEEEKDLMDIFNKYTPEIIITTVHEVKDSKGNKKEYNLDISEESLGTQKMFCLGMILQDVFEGQTMIVDELENSLHPHLVEHIIKMFHNPQINKNNAQLIFTTHCKSLLDLDLFRREQICFVEKDEIFSKTELYSLADYSVRKDENIEKGYTNGRYGAVPLIKEDI